MIRAPHEVSKIVLEKEAIAIGNVAGVEINLNDHNMMEEIRLCATEGAFSGPYQFAAAALGKKLFSTRK